TTAPGAQPSGPSLGGSSGTQPSGSAAGSLGTGAGGTAGAGMALPPGSVVTTCTPGVPATTQIPRMLNRQYDLVVNDLLGVTTVGTDNKLPSQLLVDDSDGPM